MRKVDHDINWINADSFKECTSFLGPVIIAAEIVKDVAAALEQFAPVVEDLKR